MVKLSEKTFQRFTDSASSAESVSFDIEHESKVSLRREGFQIHGCGMSTLERTVYFQNKDQFQHLYKHLATFPKLEWIAHHATYDLQGLKLSGWIPEGHDFPKVVVDTQVGTQILNPTIHPDKTGIKTIVWEKYKYKMAEYVDASNEGLHTEKFKNYAKDDAYWELYYWEDYLKPRIVEAGLYEYLTKFIAVKFFADLELTGMAWDFDRARNHAIFFDGKLKDILADVVGALGPVNPNSNNQIEQALVQKNVDLSFVPRTPTGKLSIKADDLPYLAKVVPELRGISNYKTATKMMSDILVDRTQRASEGRDSRIHSSYWLTSTTGRTRSSAPNQQNLPNPLSEYFENRALRDCFIPRKGFQLLTCDLSQAELRMMAFITRDRTMTEAYTQWTCQACKDSGESRKILHACPTCGAAENEKILKDKKLKAFWQGIDLHSGLANSVPVLHGNRQLGKVANFAIVYGILASTLNKLNPELSKEGWQQVVDGYFQRHPGVKRFHEHVKHARLNGETGERYTRDIFGKKLEIPERMYEKATQDGYGALKHLHNQLVNFPAQSSVCTYAQIALDKFRTWAIKKGHWETNVFPNNFVHDEVIVEVRKGFEKPIGKALVWCMENAWPKLNIPMRSSFEIGSNWAECH